MTIKNKQYDILTAKAIEKKIDQAAVPEKVSETPVARAASIIFSLNENPMLINDENTPAKIEIGAIGFDDNATFSEEGDSCINENDENEEDDLDGCGFEIEEEDDED